MDKMYYNGTDTAHVVITGPPSTPVNLEVIDSSSQQKLTTVVQLEPNGTRKFSFNLTSFSDGIYYAMVGQGYGSVKIGFGVGLMPSGPIIALNVMKDTYVSGDSITIRGAEGPNGIIQLSLIDPNGNVVQSVQTNSDNAGLFSSYDLKIPTNAISGIWKIMATHGATHSNVNIKVNSMSNGVEIQNIQVQPSVVTIGGKFSISATLVNNSTNPIYFETNDCTGMLSVNFDNHVKVEPKERACTLMLIENILNPGEKFTGINPPSGVTYTANSTGTVNATVTFSYGMRNQTDPNSPNIEKTIAKSFLFTIYGNNVIIKAVNETPLPPLQQLKSGIKKPDIKCSQDFVLIIKKEGHWPACVNPDTISKLVLRGWTENPLDELLLRYGNQTQANFVFYEVMNEPKVRDWSMNGWKYSSYSYASNGETQKFSATIFLYLPPNIGNHLECENGSYALVVMNLKPVEIEHNYTEVGCVIAQLTTNPDPESNRK